MKKKNPKRKKRLIILAVASVEYTSHSQFCSSCHYMKPYFESWETSSHSEFECSVCHYPPGGGIRSKLRKKIEGLVMVGRYWTTLYVKSKPWAEIRDESCLREGCHDKRLLEGQVKFNQVTFDHKIHFADLKRGKSLQCTSCHSLQKTIYQDGTWNGYQVPPDIMFAAGAACIDCHHNAQGRVTRSGAVKCLDCHEEDYRDIFTDWQNSYQELKTTIIDSLEKLSSLNLSQQEKSDLAEMRKILENLELDGSKGIHNYQFMEETMSNIQKKIKQISEKTVSTKREKL